MKFLKIIILCTCCIIALETTKCSGKLIKHAASFGADYEYFMTEKIKKLFSEFYSQHYPGKLLVNIIMLGKKTIKTTAVTMKIIQNIPVSSVKLSYRSHIGQNAVFFMDNIKTLKKYFRNLVMQHHGKYTIVIADKIGRGSGKKRLYREVFQFLWTERLVHDITILEFNKRSININFYLPFSDSKIAFVRMSKTEDYCKFFRMKNRRLFNAFGYPLKVSIFPNPPLTIPVTELFNSKNINKQWTRSANKYAGINGRYMGEIARLLNFTLEEFEPADGLEYGFVMSNGTPVGALGDVALHRADIGGNARFPIDPIPDKVRYMVPPLYNDHLCVLVPAAIPESNWGRIMPIKFRLFTILSGMVAMTTVILFSVQLKRYPGARWEHCCRIFTDLLNIFFGVPLSRLFTFSSTAERILISSCLLFALVLLSVSQSLVVSSLNVVEVREIDTLNDLFESRLEILTNYPSVKDLFKDVSNTEVRRLYNHLNLVSSYREEMLRRTELQRDVGMVTSASAGRLEEKVSRDRLGGDRPGVHLVKECTHVFYNFFLLPSGSPYR